MLIADVINCSFPNWYHRFKNVTLRSIILPFPDGFYDYLLEDGIKLPKSCIDELPKASTNDENSDDESDKVDWGSDDDEPVEGPEFEEFNQRIKDSICILGGEVFPKLNWSCPKDATWISLNNSCRCTSIDYIYYLLKSSDFITHDLTQPFIKCEDYAETSSTSIPYCLILRKWAEINPSSEFRCFVKRNALIAITQRDVSEYSEYNVSFSEDIINDIMLFYEEHIKSRFLSENYVFDVVRKDKDKVYLLDFNPFGEVTDSLLFDWSELHDMEIADSDRDPEYRCVDANRGIQPRRIRPYAYPRDIIDITTGEDSQKFVDLLKLRMGEVNLSDDDD